MLQTFHLPFVPFLSVYSHILLLETFMHLIDSSKCWFIFRYDKLLKWFYCWKDAALIRKICHFLVLIFKYKCSFYFSWFALLSHACIFLGLFLYYNFHVLFSCCFSGEVFLMLTDRFNSQNIRKQLAQSRVWQNSCQMLHHYILSSVITVSLFSHCVFMSFVLVVFFVSLINIFNLIVTWNQLCSIFSSFLCFGKW